MDRIKSRKRLPDILTKDEVIEILNCISNDKHRLIITFLYACGLRVSEVVNLKIKDLNFSNLSLKIRNTKGHKDRFSLLSEKSVEDIRKLIEGREANDYIFLTLYGKKYTIRTVQIIFSTALKKSNLQKNPIPDCFKIDFSVPSGISPGWFGIVVLALVCGFHHILWLPREVRTLHISLVRLIY